MSEYPYEGRINSDDIINCKDIFSSDGAIIGQVEAAALSESFIVRSEEEDIEIKYEIPRLEIERIVDGAIIVKQNKENIQKKYETSSIEKYQTTNNKKGNFFLTNIPVNIIAIFFIMIILIFCD
jgi:hypothetical protein